MTNRIILLLFILSFCKWCEAQKKWSLQDCIDYALKNNVSINQADLQKRLAHLSLSQTKYSQWPSLNFSGNSGYRFGLSENPTTGTFQSNNFFSTGFSMSAGVNLFNWFSKQHQLKAVNAEAKASEAAVAKAKNDVVLSVYAAYLQVLFAKEMKNMAELQLQQNGKQAIIIQKKISAGVLSELDAFQINLQLLTDSTSLLLANEAKEKSLLQLKAVLMLDAAAAFDIETVEINQTEITFQYPQALFDTAVVLLPEISVLNYLIEAGKQKIKAANSGRLPTLSMYASMGSNYVNIPSAQSFIYVPQQATGAKVFVNGNSYEVMAPSYQAAGFGITPFFRQLQKNFGQNIGLSLNVPIFSGRTLTSNLKREEINLLQLELQKNKLQQETKTTVHITYTEALAAQNKVKLSSTSVTQAAKVMDAAQKRYQLNLLSTQDLLINQNNLEKEKADLLIAKYDLAFKIRLLEFYQKGAKW